MNGLTFTTQFNDYNRLSLFNHKEIHRNTLLSSRGNVTNGNNYTLNKVETGSPRRSSTEFKKTLLGLLKLSEKS